MVENLSESLTDTKNSQVYFQASGPRLAHLKVQRYDVKSLNRENWKIFWIKSSRVRKNGITKEIQFSEITKTENYAEGC